MKTLLFKLKSLFKRSHTKLTDDERWMLYAALNDRFHRRVLGLEVESASEIVDGILAHRRPLKAPHRTETIRVFQIAAIIVWAGVVSLFSWLVWPVFTEGGQEAILVFVCLLMWFTISITLARLKDG